MATTETGRGGTTGEGTIETTIETTIEGVKAARGTAATTPVVMPAALPAVGRWRGVAAGSQAERVGALRADADAFGLTAEERRRAASARYAEQAREPVAPGDRALLARARGRDAALNAIRYGDPERGEWSRERERVAPDSVEVDPRAVRPEAVAARAAQLRARLLQGHHLARDAGALIAQLGLELNAGAISQAEYNRLLDYPLQLGERSAAVRELSARGLTDLETGRSSGERAQAREDAARAEAARAAAAAGEDPRARLGALTAEYGRARQEARARRVAADGSAAARDALGDGVGVQAVLAAERDAEEAGTARWVAERSVGDLVRDAQREVGRRDAEAALARAGERAGEGRAAEGRAADARVARAAVMDAAGSRDAAAPAPPPRGSTAPMTR